MKARRQRRRRRGKGRKGEKEKSENAKDRRGKGGTMAPLRMVASSSMFRFVPPSLRPQSTDLNAGVLWGTTLVVGAVWLVQPFEWIKTQLSTKEEAKA